VVSGLVQLCGASVEQDLKRSVGLPRLGFHPRGGLLIAHRTTRE